VRVPDGADVCVCVWRCAQDGQQLRLHQRPRGGSQHLQGCNGTRSRMLYRCVGCSKHHYIFADDHKDASITPPGPPPPRTSLVDSFTNPSPLLPHLHTGTYVHGMLRVLGLAEGWLWPTLLSTVMFMWLPVIALAQAAVCVCAAFRRCVETSLER
jgi:hypothetical protein